MFLIVIKALNDILEDILVLADCDIRLLLSFLHTKHIITFHLPYRLIAGVLEREVAEAATTPTLAMGARMPVLSTSCFQESFAKKHCIAQSYSESVMTSLYNDVLKFGKFCFAVFL